MSSCVIESQFSSVQIGVRNVSSRYGSCIRFSFWVYNLPNDSRTDDFA